MGDAQDECGCDRPDIFAKSDMSEILQRCRGCGYLVNFEGMRQRAVDTYYKDDQPIENPERYPDSERMDPNTHLRVLHLNGGRPDIDILSGTFELVSITKLPEYEAVSYCWGGNDGDYTKSEFIIIDKMVFPITKNCAAVLRKLRKPSYTRLIWVDSLCINQNDANERSTQVKQMGKVYSGAQMVHICLGDRADAIPREAFNVLESIGKPESSAHKEGIDQPKVNAVDTLFTQVYFSRMWVIQEVLLARDAQLHWGIETLPWRPLDEKRLKVAKDWAIDDFMPAWMRIQATNKNFRKSELLGELLFSAMGSKASNPRDKVYGIYGLLFDAEEEGLTVDYGLSVKQVFTNMAVHLIEKHKALSAVLRHAKHKSPLIEGERLPSWVPDFRSSCAPRSLSILFDESNDLQICSRISSKEVVFGLEGGELSLWGHRLRIFHDRHKAFTVPSKVVQCSIGEQELKWEIQAQFQVDFDPDEHIVFWMSNGLTLHLKRHPAREDTYTLLGECVLKNSGPFPTLVVHNRHASFADAMFGLEPQYLTSLWEVYTYFGRFIRHYTQRNGYRPFMLPDRWTDTEETNRVVNAYRVFCSLGVFSEHRRKRHNEDPGERYGGQRKDAARQWMFSLGAIQKANRKDMFSRTGYDSKDMFSRTGHDSEDTFGRRRHKDSVDPEIERMFDFESFWEDQATWTTLHSLNAVLQHPKSYDIRKITELCESWLQHYERAKHLIEKLLWKTGQDTALGIEILEELTAWETTTERLSKESQWAEGVFWPFEKPPSVEVRGDNQDTTLIPPLIRESTPPFSCSFGWERFLCFLQPRGEAPIISNDNGDCKEEDDSNNKKPKLETEEPVLQSEALAGMPAWDKDSKAEDPNAESSKAEEGETKDSPHDKQMMPDWVIKNNFKGVRLKLKECEDGYVWHRSAEYVLGPWGDEWAEVIRLIPRLFTAKAQLNLEKLLQLEETCLKRGAWRKENMEICQAEIITLV
ncbi:hypothetical protein BHE90_010407 [Fusarium euwallaceae]|uniref:Heterokaryon incompatibility domain-containing protein n=1 Tax=Fusarium euwallaceae TaxID=1147111 RepID=A0A430LHD8_9HYPO|nr:hypothetical protein BHE90_010407 [Fusarium euwallaceae]